MSNGGERSKLLESKTEINVRLYETCGFKISELVTEIESKEYNACRFKVDGLQVVSRTSKITPKKDGQFVTFWKRSGKGSIEPFSEKDSVNFFVVNVLSKNRLGQFVFPKSVLISKGVVSTEKKEGKRAIRVYPCWDKPSSKQAQLTQKWQLEYFYGLGDSPDLQRVKQLFAIR